MYEYEHNLYVKCFASEMYSCVSNFGNHEMMQITKLYAKHKCDSVFYQVIRYSLINKLLLGE